MSEYAPPRSQTRVNSSRRGRKVGARPYSGPAGSPRRAVQADGSVSCEANKTLVSVFCPSGGAPDGAKCGPGHVGEPGGVVVQTEGGDPEPVDVVRRGRDVVLGESISAETGVNQRPAPPTPKVTIGSRFTVSPERLIGIVLYLGLERKNSDDAGHPQCRSTTKHHMGGMS